MTVSLPCRHLLLFEVAMFGIEPLARIVRHDARIEVKVPATQGRKAYSYFREGGEGEKKPSGVGKKVALIGGGLALAGLGAAAIAMSRKKAEAGSMAAPVSEPKKVEKNNTARNAAIGVGVAGLGAAAAKIATSKKGEGLEETDFQGNSLSSEAKDFFRSHPEALKAHAELNRIHREYINLGKTIQKEYRLAGDKITEAGSKILSEHPAFASRIETEKYHAADLYLNDVEEGESKEGGVKEIKKEDTHLYKYLDRRLPDEYSLEDVDRLYSDYITAVEKTDYKKNRQKAKNLRPKALKLSEDGMKKAEEYAYRWPAFRP